MKKIKVTVLILLAVYFSNQLLPASYAYEFTPPKLNKRLRRLDKDINEKAEKFIDLISKSGALYSNEQLEAYISKVGKKLLATLPSESVKNISFKVIRDPRINAMAFPNGQIFINAGIVARLENEAQLAFLLGHEISHVVNKDMLFWMDSYHKSTVATKVLDLVVGTVSAAVGFGDLGSLGLYFLYAASVTGYGRKNEARADIDGLEFMTNAGYNPDGAIEMFDIFIKEKEKYGKGMEVFYLSSHPSNIYRKKAVIKKINELNLKEGNRLVNKDVYINSTEKVRCDNAYMDIRYDRLQHAIDNLEKFLEQNPNNAISHYYIAEAYRLIADDIEKLKHELSYKKWLEVKKVKDKEVQKKQWQELALKHYKKALECNEDYKKPIKGMGLLYRDMGRNEEAIEYLEKYLLQNPRAKDRRYIYVLLMSLKEKVEKEENE